MHGFCLMLFELEQEEAWRRQLLVLFLETYFLNDLLNSYVDSSFSLFSGSLSDAVLAQVKSAPADEIIVYLTCLGMEKSSVNLFQDRYCQFEQGSLQLSSPICLHPSFFPLLSLWLTAVLCDQHRK